MFSSGLQILTFCVVVFVMERDAIDGALDDGDFLWEPPAKKSKFCFLDAENKSLRRSVQIASPVSPGRKKASGLELLAPDGGKAMFHSFLPYFSSEKPGLFFESIV